MNARTFTPQSLTYLEKILTGTLFLLLLNFAACSKDSLPEDRDTSEDIIGLYDSSDEYKPLKVGLFTLQPPHRTGPKQTSDNQYSDLPVTIWVPEALPSPLPTIIYSHGGGSRNIPGESGPEWGKYLAKKGYAVIALHHMIRPPEDVILNICEPLNVSKSACDKALYVPYYESTDRPQDALYVMNNLAEIGSMSGYNFDPSKIVIMGFSGGTNTTHYLSGGKRDVFFGQSNESSFFSLMDERPLAYIGMSPGGGIEGGWTSESLRNVTKPFLCATGQGDFSPDHRAKFFDQIGGSDQYRLFINSQAAIHTTFNHQVKTGSEIAKQQEPFIVWLESIVIAFLDAYVHQNEQALRWLQSDTIAKIVNEALPENEQFKTWSYR